MRHRQNLIGHIKRAVLCATLLVCPTVTFAATVGQLGSTGTDMVQPCQTTPQPSKAASLQRVTTGPQDVVGHATCLWAAIDPWGKDGSLPVVGPDYQRFALTETQQGNAINITFELKDRSGKPTGRYHLEMHVTALDFAIYGVRGNDVSNGWCRTMGRVTGGARTDPPVETASVELGLVNRSGLSLSFWSDQLGRTDGWQTAKLLAAR